MFVGVSPQHSSTIGCILNIATGNVSPQYHVVYDDLFTTVPNAENGGFFGVTGFNAESWETIVQSGLERYVDDEEDEHKIPPLSPEWEPPPPSPAPLQPPSVPTTPPSLPAPAERGRDTPQREAPTDPELAAPPTEPTPVPEGAA